MERDGGPWVPGPQAMKKYVWSETVVDGGKPFTGTLNHPPSVTGPFQNLPGANPQLSPSRSSTRTARSSPTELRQATCPSNRCILR